MSTFCHAIKSQTTTTTNGMPAYVSTLNANVDLFFKIGASRNSNIIPVFSKAYNEDRITALKIAMYARDIRGGLGERKTYREILKYLEKTNQDDARLLASKTIFLGRVDDLFSFETDDLLNYAFSLVKQELEKDNSGKWIPREKSAKKDIALKFMKYLQLTPKEYRKYISSKTKVVETQMCSKEWDKIEYDHVPSVASARYRKAFTKHDPTRYQEYVNDVLAGKSKMNANVVYPHDVVKLITTERYNTKNKTVLDSIVAQWESLPNLVGDKNILPIVDVSSSMGTIISGKTSALEVSVALGMYLADKNKGKFNGCYVSFSDEPKLEYLTGNILDKYLQVSECHYYGSTNIEATFKQILKVAKENNLPQEEMPEYLLILSDMQFNSGCSMPSENSFQMIERQYNEAGYTRPIIVYWNLVAKDNVPVRFDTKGVVLVSGYSINILNSVLKGNLENMTPEKIMLDTISSKRYDI